ncbi:hypothetical protein J6590_033895 [Homalodisca vitripennis]|nr:hypothetical protein J6590_033895 [Homalodisca vitripennis]
MASAQKKVPLRVTSPYWTVSEPVVQVIASVMPIDLKTQEHKYVFDSKEELGLEEVKIPGFEPASFGIPLGSFGSKFGSFGPTLSSFGSSFGSHFGNIFGGSGIPYPIPKDIRGTYRYIDHILKGGIHGHTPYHPATTVFHVRIGVCEFNMTTLNDARGCFSVISLFISSSSKTRWSAEIGVCGVNMTAFYDARECFSDMSMFLSSSSNTG